LSVNNHPDMSSCNGASTYLATSGYRLVPSDTCSNPLAKYAPQRKTCPNTANTNGGDDTIGKHVATLPGWAIAMIVMACSVALAMAALLGMVIVTRSDRVRAMFPWVKLPKMFHVGFSQLESDDPNTVGFEDSQAGEGK